jgi:hypothetical protein
MRKNLCLASSCFPDALAGKQFHIYYS